VEINFDLAKHFDAAVERIEASEVDKTLTPELRESILTQPRAALCARVQDALRDFRIDRIPAALADYKAALRETVRFERERLRPKSVGEELQPWFRSLDDRGWRAPEKTAIKSMLEPGEQPTAVDFRAMTTNRRKITRDDVRQFALGQRPRWQVDLPDSLRPSEFLAWAGFPTDEQIAELERVARHVERRQHIRTAGPAHTIGKEYR
jgi:hypothetical protein